MFPTDAVLLNLGRAAGCTFDARSVTSRGRLQFHMRRCHISGIFVK